MQFSHSSRRFRFLSKTSRPRNKRKLAWGGPDLPVIVDPACPFEGCFFEGCFFREWSVEKDSIVYSSWQDNRTQAGTLKTGEKVQGITGVHIIRQPDRFLVTQPIPALSFKVGDVVLQYGEWGESTADLWAGGQWHKSFDWGSTDDGDLILTDKNLQLVRRGIKEWWVRISNSSGHAGWLLTFRSNHDGFWDDGNFANLYAD